MAFFVGLMLFKDVYVFVHENKGIKELGYINFDTRLTNLFTVPENEPEKLLHLATIYKLLHGSPDFEADEENNIEQVDDTSIELVDDTSATITNATDDLDIETAVAAVAVAMYIRNRDGDRDRNRNRVSVRIEYIDNMDSQTTSATVGSDSQRLGSIFNRSDFKAYYNEIVKTLTLLDIIPEEEFENCDNNKKEYAKNNLYNFRFWLVNFVNENEISFDELFVDSQ